MSLKKAQPDPEAGAGYGTIELEATTEPRTQRRRVVLAAAVTVMVVFAYKTPRPGPWPGYLAASESGLCTESRTLTPDQCPSYEELTSAATPGVANRSASIRITRESELCGETATRTYEWEFFYTPGAGVVDPGTPKEIAAFYEGLGPRETFAPIAYTNPHFEYFQCIYAYSEGYAFALNLDRDAMPPKQERVGFSYDDCPPRDMLKTKCAEEDGSSPIAPMAYGGFTFIFQGPTSDGKRFEAQSGEKWKRFCDETVANSNGHSANLVDVSPTESQAFCTYWWGEFAWTHGLTTTFSSDLSTDARAASSDQQRLIFAGKQLEEQVTPSLSLSPCVMKKHRAVTDQIDESSIPGRPETEADCAGNEGDDDYDDASYKDADNDPVTDDADNDDAHDDGQVW